MNPVEYSGEVSGPVSGETSGQENRITFQLYDYWIGLAGDQDIPPLKALAPESIAPYKNNMVLIDLRDPEKEPTLQVIGQLLRQDIDQDLILAGISEIPRRTILSRITDHYMEVLANKSPISFDAEFTNKAKEKILYRGILLPFSDDGENINFILGAIRWIGGSKTPETETESTPEQRPQSSPQTEGSLQSQLDYCRRLVQGKNTATDIRSRKSLYKTLGAILDFHETCCANPDQYSALLQSEGLKAQKRAPFTPCLKLCFGAQYDKTRLTEYAAALSFAKKSHKSGAEMPEFLDQFPGGIKGCVQAMREGRVMVTDEAAQDSSEKKKKIIHAMAPIASFSITALAEKAPEADINEDELCLILGRRNGTDINILKILKEDEKILPHILRLFMKKL
ncbi:MAG: hypothetical protein L3J58_03315 [Emcibacter sp.]|nr:hypothetical protein [Emcibacter sp.]